jgi:outer membrane beta-barrel protein
MGFYTIKNSDKSALRWRNFVCSFVIFMSFASPSIAEDFEGYEIRVIRPKFMTKRGRTEVAGQGTLIMNQSFIYTLMASGILNYHFSESLAIELGGSYGASIDKEDKRILEDEFDINTQILRTQYIFNGGLLWTPIYGKTQLPAGDVVYFDSFLSFQAGMTGVSYTYEQCETVDDRPDLVQPAPQTKSYPTFLIGFGQKYFLSKTFGLRWDVRDYLFSYEKGDGTCTPDVPIGSSIHQNITLQWGASKFF